MTCSPAKTRWHFKTCVWLVGVLIGLLNMTAWAGQITEPPFEVGQRWEYQHEGPRPGSLEPNPIDGQRILHVISVVEGQSGKTWTIEERFTNSTKVIGRLFVDEGRLLTAIEIENEKGEIAKLRYDPPVPYQMTELEVGQDRTIEAVLRMDSADFAMPTTIAIERLDDETIVTPAAQFVGCLHFKTTVNARIDIKIAKIPVTEQWDRWYHPQVCGVVKAVYQKGPVKFLHWSRPGYTATSVLTTFGTREVEPQIQVARRIETNEQGQSGNPQSKLLSSAPARLIALGAVVAVALGAWVLTKRASSR